MSYANMDHAGWVENNNLAGKNRIAGKKPKLDGHGRAVGYAQAPDKLSDFQARVMDILGIVYGGIYNASINWETVDWQYGGKGVSLIAFKSNDWSTFDFDRLTMFVFLCHEARIRGEIQVHGPQYYRLSFWQRTSEGSISRRHPNLEEAVADFRKYVPADHRIMYREPAAKAEPEPAA